MNENGRGTAALVFVGGVLGMAWTEFFGGGLGVGSLFLALFAPMFALLGAAGLVYPPIFLAMNAREGEFPITTKAIGLFVAMLGLAVAYLLARDRYGLF